MHCKLFWLFLGLALAQNQDIDPAYLQAALNVVADTPLSPPPPPVPAPVVAPLVPAPLVPAPPVSVPQLDAKSVKNDATSEEKNEKNGVPDPCSICHGKSACVIQETGEPKCVCPPDFMGPRCSQHGVNTNGSCANKPCLNGATCVPESGGFICVCPRNYVGLLCGRQARIFTMSILVYKGNDLLPWDAAKEENAISSRICNNVQRYFKTGVNSNVGVLFDHCLPYQFDLLEIMIEGTMTKTVHTIMELKFDSGLDVTENQLDTVAIGDQLQSGYKMSPPNTDVIGVNPIKDQTIKIAELDYCGKEENNDCSQFGKCSISNNVGYQCVCSRFYSDGSAEIGKMPGRICEFNAGLGALAACLTLAPFIVGSILIFFKLRKQQKRRFWIRANHIPAFQPTTADSLRDASGRVNGANAINLINSPIFGYSV